LSDFVVNIDTCLLWVVAQALSEDRKFRMDKRTVKRGQVSVGAFCCCVFDIRSHSYPSHARKN